MIKTSHRWTRLSSAKWEDAWQERLRFLGEGRVVFVTWPDSRALKIETYCDERTAKHLVKRFGGRATRLAKHIWTGEAGQTRAPLAIRGKLRIHADEESWRARGPKPPGIFIPAGMAFGTGEHATTATCLRFLADLLAELPPGFTVLDLGTGSGILAIGAAALGAGRVEANDFDPAAVRIAKENVKTNGAKNVHVSQDDVLRLKTPEPFDLVMANLYSEVLIAAAPRMAKAVKPKGWLIFSGVLRRQAAGVSRALRAAGLGKPRIIARGKWCAGLCQRARPYASR